MIYIPTHPHTWGTTNNIVEESDYSIRACHCGAIKINDELIFIATAGVITVIETICKDCGGTGEVSKTEAVYPGEPHMADVGSEPCHCQIKEDDHDAQD